MCLQSNVPLVDCGTGGYLGQVMVFIKNKTECYSCTPQPIPTTYPVCTIRNTPSKLIHCVVWAKNLYSELFAETEGEDNSEEIENEDTNIMSINKWFLKNNKNVDNLMKKIFIDDIENLLRMSNLWVDRKPPDTLPQELIKSKFTVPLNKKEMASTLSEDHVPDVKDCVQRFKNCLNELMIFNKNIPVPFDKDNNICICFVGAAANIRAHLFGISKDSYFNIKTMAGNIIPAIATTNDIISALCVIQVIKLLSGDGKPNEVYLSQFPMSGKLISPQLTSKPNPNCYACSSKPTISICCDPSTLTVRQLRDQVLLEGLGITRPDVEIDDLTGSILLSSQEDETVQNLKKPLSFFGICAGSILKVEDFLSNHSFQLIIASDSSLDNKLFEFLEIESLTPSEKNENIPQDHSKLFDKDFKLAKGGTDQITGSNFIPKKRTHANKQD
ncbi:hypothetical protein HZS_6949 [Henneguya salminicola]|nr:hypothetical protein HZS_6949 [Henneguya salminicola]